MLGGRDDATCQKLLDKVGIEGKTFLTDDWEGFHRLIPEDQLFTGKDLTFSIEQDNSDIRHFLARFRRRTKVVSKSPSWSICPCAFIITCTTTRKTSPPCSPLTWGV
jgi:insertion element IS1 protein InsB